MGLFRQSEPQHESRIALCMLEDGLAIVVADHAPSDQLVHADFLSCTPVERVSVLANYLADKSIEHARCHLVLSPQDYRLFCLDAPQVPREEWQPAARWLVKDLVEQPLHELAIEVFPLPHPSGTPDKMYVIAAEIARIKGLCAELASLNIKVDLVDIYELPLASLIAEALQVNGHPIAVVYSDQVKLWVAMLLDDQLIMTRELVPASALADPNQYETIGLELQRSMDFLQTQMRHSAVVKCVLMPSCVDQQQLASGLAQQLAVPIECFQFAQYLPELSGSDVQRCLAVVGGMLRWVAADTQSEAEGEAEAVDATD